MKTQKKTHRSRNTSNLANDRICYSEIQLDKYKVIFLVAYIPTLIVSEQSSATREKFYEILSEVTNRIIKSKHLMITIGELNTKTGI